MEQRTRLRGEELHQAIVTARRAGKEYAEIADELRCGHGVISNVLRQAGLTRPRRQEAQATPGQWPRTVQLPAGASIVADGSRVALQLPGPEAVVTLLEAMGVQVVEVRRAVDELQHLLATA